jgi:hypothetical protein
LRLNSYAIQRFKRFRDEVDVARQSAELGDDYRTPRPARLGHGGGEDRPSIERVGALAALDLGEFADQFVSLAVCEPLDRLALRIEPKTRPALPLGADPVVREGGRSGRPLRDHGSAFRLQRSDTPAGRQPSRLYIRNAHS